MKPDRKNKSPFAVVMHGYKIIAQHESMTRASISFRIVRRTIEALDSDAIVELRCDDNDDGIYEKIIVSNVKPVALDAMLVEGVSNE